MKKILLLIICLFFYTSVFAETVIYCPKCRTPLYVYEKEIIKGEQIRVEDFKPVDKDTVPQPQAGEEMICPLDGAYLNGWEYWLKKQHYKSYNLAYPALSLLTKEKNNKWVWVPDDMPQLNFNEGNQ